MAETPQSSSDSHGSSIDKPNKIEVADTYRNSPDDAPNGLRTLIRLMSDGEFNTFLRSVAKHVRIQRVIPENLDVSISRIASNSVVDSEVHYYEGFDPDPCGLTIQNWILRELAKESREKDPPGLPEEWEDNYETNDPATDYDDDPEPPVYEDESMDNQEADEVEAEIAEFEKASAEDSAKFEASLGKTGTVVRANPNTQAWLKTQGGVVHARQVGGNRNFLLNISDSTYELPSYSFEEQDGHFAYYDQAGCRWDLEVTLSPAPTMTFEEYRESLAKTTGKPPTLSTVMEILKMVGGSEIMGVVDDNPKELGVLKASDSTSEIYEFFKDRIDDPKHSRTYMVEALADVTGGAQYTLSIVYDKTHRVFTVDDLQDAISDVGWYPMRHTMVEKEGLGNSGIMTVSVRKVGPWIAIASLTRPPGDLSVMEIDFSDGPRHGHFILACNMTVAGEFAATLHLGGYVITVPLHLAMNEYIQALVSEDRKTMGIGIRSPGKAGWKVVDVHVTAPPAPLPNYATDAPGQFAISGGSGGSISVNAPQKLTISPIEAVLPGELHIMGPDMKTKLLTVTRDGTIHILPGTKLILGDNVATEKWARHFWDAVAQYNPLRKEVAKKDTDIQRLADALALSRRERDALMALWTKLVREAERRRKELAEPSKLGDQAVRERAKRIAENL